MTPREELERAIDAAYGRAFGVGVMPAGSRDWFALGYRAALTPAAPSAPSPTAPDAAGGVVELRDTLHLVYDLLAESIGTTKQYDFGSRAKRGIEKAALALAHPPLDAVEVARMHEALSIVAKAAGYETAWLAPSGTPNIILERKHPTEAGKIQVTRLDIAVSPAVEVARSLDATLADAHRWFDAVIPHDAKDDVEKFREESAEFLENPCIEEAADAILCLTHWAHLMGFDLHAAIRAKVAKNKGRKWERQPNGTWKHKEPSQ